MILPWKFWSMRRRSAVIMAPVLVTAVAVPVFLIAGPIPGVGTLAAIIALGSLVTSAVSTSSTWRRAKKKDTLEAWADWSDSSIDDRRAFTKIFDPIGGLDEDQARAMCDFLPVIVDGTTLDADVVRELKRGMLRSLGGLERIAVGIEHGVYDLDITMEVGGTILVGTYERYRRYIHYLQNHPDQDRRKVRAYVALGALVADLESEPIKKRRQYFDTSRIARMKHATDNPDTLAS